MNKSPLSKELLVSIGNWDWQPQALKLQFGALTLSDVQFEVGKEEELLSRIGKRLNKKRQDVIDLLNSLRPAYYISRISDRKN